MPSTPKYSDRETWYLITNVAAKTDAEIDLHAESWRLPYSIDDSDLTFDGKPLNMLYEENRHYAESHVCGSREKHSSKESHRSRGRSRHSKKWEFWWWKEKSRYLLGFRLRLGPSGGHGHATARRSRYHCGGGDSERQKKPDSPICSCFRMTEERMDLLSVKEHVEVTLCGSSDNIMVFEWRTLCWLTGSSRRDSISVHLWLCMAERMEGKIHETS